MNVKHPIQPVVRDEDGCARFKPNKIVRFLIDYGQSKGVGLNELTMMPFDREDWEQLAQLMGYSVSGFGDLSYASDEVYAIAAAEVEKLPPRKKRP